MEVGLGGKESPGNLLGAVRSSLLLSGYILLPSSNNFSCFPDSSSPPSFPRFPGLTLEEVMTLDFYS
jgi:hypothetical protein